MYKSCAIERNQTVTACKRRKKKFAPFYFIILLNVRVRFDTARKKTFSLNILHPFQKAAAKVLYRFSARHIKFSWLRQTLHLSLDENFLSFWIIKIVCGTAMPYCKIFIWFLLLFFIFFFYYLCNSFFGARGESKRCRAELVPAFPSFPFHWLHHLTSSRRRFSEQPIHLCAWCFKSIPFNIN